MKRLFLPLLALLLALAGCQAPAPQESGWNVAATTYPVYLLARELTAGVDGVTATAVIRQPTSCLHDYTLTMNDMKALERADVIAVNGAGLEDFLEDALEGRTVIDCSLGVELLASDGHDHHAGEAHDHGDHDPHIWMDPDRYLQMADNLCASLSALDPEHADAYAQNLDRLREELTQAAREWRQALEGLSCRRLITFHDGFAYFAQAFDLELLAAIEEEEGSEASAKEIVEIVALVEEYRLPSIFVEVNGSDATAEAISRECGVAVHPLSMLMSGPDDGSEATYRALMQRNIDTLLEALG